MSYYCSGHPPLFLDTDKRLLVISLLRFIIITVGMPTNPGGAGHEEPLQFVTTPPPADVYFSHVLRVFVVTLTRVVR